MLYILIVIQNAEFKYKIRPFKSYLSNYADQDEEMAFQKLKRRKKKVLIKWCC